MKLAYSKACLRVLRQMPANEARRIRSKIEAYAADPASQANHVAKLQGRDGYRLRVGDWRVIYRVDDKLNSVFVASIAHRREAYQ